MKLDFKSSNPSSLRNDIITMVEDDELQTWEIHLSENHKYLKHTGQWGEKGVIKLTPDNINKKMEVQVLKFKNTEGDVRDFEGYIYGRFCELIFVNFTNKFTSIDRK